MAKPPASKSTRPGTTRPKAGKVKVNFDGVETRLHVPDGLYHSKVVEASLEDGKEYQYIKWTFGLVGGQHDGRKVYTNTSLSPNALWNLRNLLETLGVDTPDSEFELDLDSYTDLELMLRIENEVYEGKDRPKVTDYQAIGAEVTDDEAPAEDAAEETEAEEEAAEETAEEEAPEDDGKLSAEEIREMDEAELKDLVRKHKLAVDFKTIVKPGKRIAAVIDAMESKDLLKE
jgi:hypothetical protein